MQELFYLTDNRVVGQTLKGNSHLRLSCLADLQYSGLSGGSDFILEQPLPQCACSVVRNVGRVKCGPLSKV